jgi:hypothetical protein
MTVASASWFAVVERVVDVGQVLKERSLVTTKA